MNGIETFKEKYGLSDQAFLLMPYGSRVYGTATDKSDYDYVAIVLGKTDVLTGEEFVHHDTNIHIYTVEDWQKQLNEHKIHTLEAYYLPAALGKDIFHFRLNLPMLRHSLMEKASHSYVKAKKKIEKERDFLRGWKSLFHSLRILDFGHQIATKGKIEDYGSTNHHWFAILNSQEYNWTRIENKYKSIYNELASKFRLVAQK